MVTKSEVIDAYRLILGREPEDEAVVEGYLSLPDWRTLRHLFFESQEFKQLSKANSVETVESINLVDFVMSPPSSVDVNISDEHFDRLIKRVKAAWERLGDSRPHWSVIVRPEFLPEEISENISHFYDTGARDVESLEKAAARAGKQLPTDGVCFELGCGVGRVTAQLARHFREVLATDISQPHLDVAERYLRDNGIDNVALLHLTSLDILEALEPFDLFYSIIVLQHNPPPLIYRILSLVLARARLGGLAFFQVPVAFSGYKFSISDYLEASEASGGMEMHILPQVYLFRLLDEHGFQILDLQRDCSAGPEFYSVTVLAQKIR